MASPADLVPTQARLPPELWMRVFFWATDNSARDLRSLLTVPLFDGIVHHQNELQTREALRVKAALTLVCRQWRALSEQYLYEDLRIRHGKRTLADVLERSQGEEATGLGRGQYVKRIILPQMQKNTAGHGHSRHWADEDTSRIIKCCPNLLVLSRYYKIFVKENQESNAEEILHDSNDEEPDCCSIHDPVLPFIKRLDWCNGTMRGDPWHPTICAVPSALWSTQQLEVLSLSGDNYFWGPADLQSLTAEGRGTILLPKVHTLRVASLYAFGVPGVSNYKMALPALRRIILDRGEALHRLAECVFTSPLPFPLSSFPPPDHKTYQGVTALEIGSPHWRFSRSDYISTLIRNYPTATSLHYPVFFARPLRWRRLRDNGLSYGARDVHRIFSNLRRVGLHSEPNPELSYSNENENADATWSHLYAHARALLGSTTPTLMESRLPGIKEIVLYGNEWITFVRDNRFQIVLDLARERGAEIKADDVNVAQALAESVLQYRSDLILECLS